jgi:hypothetical protein
VRYFVFYDAVTHALTGAMTTADASLPGRQGQPFIEVSAPVEDLDAWEVEAGEKVPASTLTVATRSAAVAAINETIGRARTLFITATPGQEMTYQAKQAEAAAYLAVVPAPTDLTKFPFIAAEIGISGADAIAVATLFAAKSAQWSAIGASLERLRMTAATAISAAADRAAFDAARAAFSTDLDAMLAAAGVSL